jgi:hypothetical protein
MIKVLGTGLIYRNPIPHVHSVHAIFPSVAVMANGEMLATFVLAEAFEAPNMHTHYARSKDNGKTWKLEGALYPGTPNRLTSDSARLTALPDGEVVAYLLRADRSAHPHEGLANPKTLGFVPTEFLITRSKDFGRRWSAPKAFKPPLEGPCFELCCPMTPLRDGRWLLPTSTWNDWAGRWASGKKMVAFVSHDRGRTWPEHLDVMVDARQRVRYWESKIVQLPDESLLAAAWAYDEVSAKDLPNQYALSGDGGKTWTSPRSTGLKGQTLTPHVLADGRVLSVYRRMDKGGLWANVSRLKGGRWVNEECAPLWGANVQGLTCRSRSMAHNFNVLRFGAPSICRLPDGTIFVAFWCYEQCVGNIRWFKLRVTG